MSCLLLQKIYIFSDAHHVFDEMTDTNFDMPGVREGRSCRSIVGESVFSFVKVCFHMGLYLYVWVTMVQFNIIVVMELMLLGLQEIVAVALDQFMAFQWSL